MPSKSAKRILITAGGTGGHLYPAQALAQQISKETPSAEILFVAGGLATNHFFDRAAFTFKEIYCGTLTKNPLKFIKNSIKIFAGIQQSLKIIQHFKPDVVVGFGSYYTVPVLLASKMSQVPFVLHEANSIPGKANKWLAPYAAYVGVHFPFTTELLKGRVVEVGLPIREDYYTEMDKASALKHFGLAEQELTLLIFGGSQGACAINQLMEEALPYLNGLKMQFIHLVGKNENVDQVVALYKKYLFSAHIKAFEPHMQLAWKAADLFIGRAGASTIGEAIECEVPGILIPYPYATNDHQNRNADFFTENVKAGIKLPQKELTGQRLANEIKKMIGDNSLHSMKMNMKSYKKRPKMDLCQLIWKVMNKGKL